MSTPRGPCSLPVLREAWTQGVVDENTLVWGQVRVRVCGGVLLGAQGAALSAPWLLLLSLGCCLPASLCRAWPTGCPSATCAPWCPRSAR